MERGADPTGFNSIEVKKETTSVALKYAVCVLLTTESVSKKTNFTDIRKNSQQSKPLPHLAIEGRLRPHKTLRSDFIIMSFQRLRD
jgi:hypothetical protein